MAALQCPSCLSEQVTAQKKGFSGTKAVAGAVAVGGVGLLAGLHGSSDVQVTCLNCGTSWNPKQLADKKAKEAAQQQTQELTAWKQAFYKAYEQKDFKQATALYMAQHPFLKETPDIHFVYKEQKKSDRLVNLLMAGLIGFFVLLLVWFLS